MGVNGEQKGDYVKAEGLTCFKDSSVDGHLSFGVFFFQFLASVNNGMSLHLQAYLWRYVFISLEYS